MNFLELDSSKDNRERISAPANEKLEEIKKSAEVIVEKFFKQTKAFKNYCS